MNTLKYEQLKQIIQNNIRDGIWKAGQKIPAENLLCKQFDVSKTTVKKAKHDLLMEGVLETLPGRKGAFVTHVTTQPFSSTGLIGVAISDVNDPHFALILKGIEDKLWENKLHTILCNAYYDVDKVEEYISSLIAQRVAGMIFSPVIGPEYIENNRRIIQMLTEHHVPYVLVDRYIPGLFLNAVVSNNIQGSKVLTETLLQKGHTRILVLTGLECSSTNERLQGHLEALQEAGIDHDPRLLIRINDILPPDQQQQVDELKRIRALVQKAGGFTACYTMNSTLLRTALQVLCPHTDPSAAIPFEIATYDYSINELFGHTNRVTVAKQPGYHMGWEAAKLLLKNMKNPDQYIVQMAIKTEIVEETLPPLRR